MIEVIFDLKGIAYFVTIVYDVIIANQNEIVLK